MLRSYRNTSNYFLRDYVTMANGDLFTSGNNVLDIMFARESSPDISLVFITIYYFIIYLFIKRIFSLLCMTCSRVDQVTVFLTPDIRFYFTNRLTAGRLRFYFPWKLKKPLATAGKQ